MPDALSLRLAVVGCGAVAERYHLPAISASPFVDLVAVCDAQPERAAEVASRFGQPLVLESYEELPGRIDAAIVAVPNHLHARVAADLLRAGIHVLVEKPMARTAAECDAMLAAAAESGVVLAVGHDFRFFPVARLAKNLFTSGLLGDVESVDLHQSATGRWPSASPAVYSTTAGGGVLLDFGVHVLDLLMWWLGEAQPRSYRDDEGGGVEAECELELELSSGAAAFVVLSRARPLRDTFLVRCTHGIVEIGVFEPALIRLTLGGSAPSLVGDAVDSMFSAAPLVTLFGRQLADFAEAVRDGRSPLVPGEEGRRAVALVESCYALREPLRRAWDFPEAYAATGSEAL